MDRRPGARCIVIGSGFGGAVSACRLAQAGFDVTVLERGRRFGKDASKGQTPFPRNWQDPFMTGFFWEGRRGLVDIKPINEMQIVQASGWGGGSLMYANVHLRPLEDVFAESNGWPKGYSRAALDPYYDLVGYMLDIKPITQSPQGAPPKGEWLKQAAKNLGRDEHVYVNIAVNFDETGAPAKANRHGAMQSGCTYCGECVIGCNETAKNTLDFNYLFLAEKLGAKAMTDCEVSHIESLGNSGYRVHYRNCETTEELAIEGDYVFLCAGAVNSTEILLRSRHRKTLSGLSEKLGEGYSGNGDLLGFAFAADKGFEPSKGPTITSGIVFDHTIGDRKVWFILEEGGFPKELTPVVNVMDPRRPLLSDFANLVKRDIENEFREHVGMGNEPLPPNQDLGIFLAMGRDRCTGHIRLRPEADTVCIDWELEPNMSLYETEEQLATDVARAMGAKEAFEPFWKRLRVPISVHNLGGCVMGDSAQAGVTSPDGEVFGQKNLFVLDGAILPSATGVNPSHTIAAVAERNIERFIRRTKSDWQAPEWQKKVPISDPVTKLYADRPALGASGTKLPRTPAIGLVYEEVMNGFVAPGEVPEAATVKAFLDAAAAGEKTGAAMQAELSIVVSNVIAFTTDPSRSAQVKGKVKVAGFTGEGGADITSGVFKLFASEAKTPDHRIDYLLPFYGADGKPYLLDGHKTVGDTWSEDAWGTFTTVYTVVREGHTRQGKVVAAGVLRLSLSDFLSRLPRLRVVDAPTWVEKMETVSRFGRAVLGAAWEATGQREMQRLIAPSSPLRTLGRRIREHPAAAVSILIALALLAAGIVKWVMP